MNADHPKHRNPLAWAEFQSVAAAEGTRHDAKCSDCNAVSWLAWREGFCLFHRKSNNPVSCDYLETGEIWTRETMDDKIKAKAQEVRLALLEALARQVKDVETSVPAEEVSGNIGHLAGILNQLDPGAGIGSYATAIDPQELGGMGGYSTK